MGCILSSPVELIRVQRCGSTAFRCAVAEMQGWRVGHEDAHEMHCDSSSGLFFVLDGHGGDGAALYSAPELVRELKAEVGEGGKLPSDERVEKGFAAVDARFRSFVAQHPEKDSGTTVVGALVSRQGDGSYSIKLLNCGDSRGLIVSGPGEEEVAVSVRIPAHLDELKRTQAAGEAEVVPTCRWPVIAESIDHKPNHPTEKGRIEAAGGHVTEEDPPRLDGNLAVSRGLGDFEYKGDNSRSVPEQKVSCVPDIYEVSGLKPGSICILGCDGVWDVMTGEHVAQLVRERLTEEPKADLGEIAAEIVRSSLAKNSRDNVTVMVVHLVDGSDWSAEPDEMKNYEKLTDETADLDDDVKKQYLAFLRKSKFPATPCACACCSKWVADMNQCPCKQVYYCTRQCQKKGWKAHKPACSATASTPSPPAKPSKGGRK